MSLIDDALKRAQAAGGAPPGPDPGASTPLPLPDAGRRRAGGDPRRALLFLLPAALLVAVIVLLARRREQPPEDRRVTEGSEVTPFQAPARPVNGERGPVSGAAAADIAAEVAVPPPPPDRPGGGRDLSVGAGGARPGSTDAPVSTEEPAPPARIDPYLPVLASPPIVASGSPSIVRAGPSVTSIEEPRTRSPARGRSFVREGLLSSGGRIVLDGIVYSEDHPAAVINGRVVSRGSFVDGAEVLRIRPDRVELKDGSATIVVSLR